MFARVQEMARKGMHNHNHQRRCDVDGHHETIIVVACRQAYVSDRQQPPASLPSLYASGKIKNDHATEKVNEAAAEQRRCLSANRSKLCLTLYISQATDTDRRDNAQ